MTTSSTPNIVIFPFMAQGHTIPLLDLSKALAHRNIKITIITTPSNAPFIHSKVSNYSSISLKIIPFPRVKELPEKCENTTDLPSMDLYTPFINATKNLKTSFENILTEMSQNECLPLCIISDFFLSWTLESCHAFGIPRISFSGCGVLPMLVNIALEINPLCMSSLSLFDVVHFSNLNISFPLQVIDLPEPFRYANLDDNPISNTLKEIGEADANSRGFIINSFDEFEGEYVSNFQKLYHNNFKIWCIGPLVLYDYVNNQETNNNEKYQSLPYMKWLDCQNAFKGVLYVSFGTQANLSDHQLDEIAFGLEMSKEKFIWVNKSKSWTSPIGWEDRIKDKGWLLRGWVDQRGILSHPKVQGFLSHCGWNSIIESLSMGVPLLAWPDNAEQFVNAKYITLGHEIGMKVPDNRNEGKNTITLHRNVICEQVKELMKGEKGKIIREKAKKIETLTKQAVEKGGSSSINLDRFIESLKDSKK